MTPIGKIETMNISSFLRRVFRKPRPARVEYLPESSLPDDARELVRAGVIEPWRTDHYGTPWYRANQGAIQWWQRSFGGETDDN